MSGGSSGADAVPALPETLSASLDMTTELPRVRDSEPTRPADGAPTQPARYTDDLTVELPIFRALESAWFRTRSSASSAVSASSRGDSMSSDAAMAGSPVADGNTVRRSDFGAGSHGAAGSAGEVSWRSIADEGWHKAQAASQPKDGGTTEAGLPRRVPMAQLVPGGVEATVTGPERRSPDAVRGLLSAYHRGVQRGRSAHGRSAEAAPVAEMAQTSGKEQDG